MSKLKLIATSAFGIESIVASELKNLGKNEIKVSNGAVEFVGDFNDLINANLWLRCADRVFIKLKSFVAEDFEQLFQGTLSIEWENFLPKDAIIHVTGKSVKSKLKSVSHCQSIVKKAIVESLKRKYKQNWFNESGPKYRIEISILKDEATISIDTSGTGLHKRGYREQSGLAPLRETTAAAILYLSKWNKSRTLIDPFCGSGTILIEAAMIARNMAPGRNRYFAFQNWPNIPQKLWKDARSEARELVSNEEIEIFGYEIDIRAFRIAVENSVLAGVENSIVFQKKSFRELSTKRQYGCIVTNPPYGERLDQDHDLLQLYRDMGELFRNKLNTWSYFILTSLERFETLFGKKATKNRKLYNGKIKTYLHQYYGPLPPNHKFSSEEISSTRAENRVITS